jgi:hypothetical protein
MARSTKSGFKRHCRIAFGNPIAKAAQLLPNVAGLFVFALVLLSASPAWAQANQENPFGGGSRLRPNDAQIVQSGVTAARKVMQVFGQCVYDRRPAKAEHFMALPMDTREYDKLETQMTDELGDSCLSGDGTLQYSSGLFRGALFEAAYRKKFGAHPITSFDSTKNMSLATAYAKPWSDVGKRHIIVQDLAECVVRGNPAEVHTLMLTSTSSPKENGMVTELSTKLGPCLLSGQKAEISKPSLRAFLAEAIYRLSVASAAPATGAQ